MGDDAPAAAAASPSPSPSPSSPSSSGASPRAKRRRTDRYALGFEFAPRLAPYEVPPAPRAAGSGAGAAAAAGPEWTERATFALLDAWGDRFVRSGRRGIRADEWLEIARLATAAESRPEGYFSEAQCRNRVDTLRKKFKKERERARLAARRSRTSPASKWAYYDKMVALLCPPPPSPPPPLQTPVPIVTRRRDTLTSPRLRWGMQAPESLLGGGVDARPRNSGSDAELGGPQKIAAVAGNPGAVAGNSGAVAGSTGAVAGNSDAAAGNTGAAARNTGSAARNTGAAAGNSNGLAVVMESIQKFGEVFMRMESSKSRHMAEVEQMRKDFQRDLDAKWREILEKAQVEIASLADESDAEEDGDLGDANNSLEDGGGEKRTNGS